MGGPDVALRPAMGASPFCRAWVGSLAIGLGVAGCGARAGLDVDRPVEPPPGDSGAPPPFDAFVPPDVLDAKPPADVVDSSTPDADDSSLRCAVEPPSRSYPLTGCGDLGPRIDGEEPTQIDRQLPCLVDQAAFACGATPLSTSDCEAFCLSNDFNLLLLNQTLSLTCEVWVYDTGAHEVECDTTYQNPGL